MEINFIALRYQGRGPEVSLWDAQEKTGPSEVDTLADLAASRTINFPFEYVADGVDQEADDFTIGLDYDVHGVLVFRAGREFHPVMEVNGCDDLS